MADEGDTNDKDSRRAKDEANIDKWAEKNQDRLRNRIDKDSMEPRMLWTAVGFDVLSGIVGLLPFVGPVLDDTFLTPAFSWGMYIWYKMCRVKFSEQAGAKLASYWGFFLLKMVPILQELPWETASVWYMIKLTQAEDKKHNKELLKDIADAKRYGRSRTRRQVTTGPKRYGEGFGPADEYLGDNQVDGVRPPELAGAETFAPPKGSKIELIR